MLVTSNKRQAIKRRGLLKAAQGKPRIVISDKPPATRDKAPPANRLHNHRAENRADSNDAVSQTVAREVAHSKPNQRHNTQDSINSKERRALTKEPSMEPHPHMERGNSPLRVQWRRNRLAAAAANQPAARKR